MEHVWSQRYPEQRHHSLRKAMFFALAVCVEGAVIWGLMSLDWQHGTPVVPPKILAWIQPEAQPEPVKPTPPEPVMKHTVRQDPTPITRPVPEEPPTAQSTPDAVALPDATGPAQPDLAMPSDIGTSGAPAPLVRKGMVPVHRVAPNYPLQARRSGIEGVVVAHLYVKPDGTVERVQIVSATPRGAFEREVGKVLMQWRFAPEAVGFIGEVEVAFRLSGTENER